MKPQLAESVLRLRRIVKELKEVSEDVKSLHKYSSTDYLFAIQASLTSLASYLEVMDIREKAKKVAPKQEPEKEVFYG